MIGKMIAERRAAAGLTQQQVCDRVGWSRPTLIATEAGDRACSPGDLIALAKAMDCQVSDLVTDPHAPLSLEPLAFAADVFRLLARQEAGEVSIGRVCRAFGCDIPTAREISHDALRLAAAFQLRCGELGVK